MLAKNWWTLVLLFLGFVFFVAQNFNHRFWLNDFTVYYDAGKHMLKGENLYQIPAPEAGPHYVYKYSPVAAFFFVPFSVFPLPLAKILFYWFLVLILIWALHFSFSFFERGEISSKNWILLATFLILSPHYQRELHLGQVNLVMLALLLLTLRSYLRNKSLAVAALWSVTFFLKPQVFLFLPYFLVKRNFKILALILLCLVIGFLLPTLLWGWHINLEQHKFWWQELSRQMQGGNLPQAKHNLAGFLGFWLGFKSYFISHPSYGKLFSLGLTLLVGVFLLVFLRKKPADSPPVVAEFSWLMFLMPLLSVTDTQSFLFGTLAVVLILFHWQKSRLAWPVVLFLLTAFFLVGGNWHDLWGDKIFLKWEEAGLLGLGSTMLLGYIYVLRMKRIY